jgi:hypothetical protein
MTDRKKEEIIGYYTEDGDIYCVECISKNIRVMNEIDRAITAKVHCTPWLGQMC